MPAAAVDGELQRVLDAHDGDMTQPDVQLLLRTSRFERSLFAKTAKAAVDAGVAERYVRQVNLEGQILASALFAALNVLDLTPEQRETALAAAHAQLGAEADQAAAKVKAIEPRGRDDVA